VTKKVQVSVVAADVDAVERKRVRMRVEP